MTEEREQAHEEAEAAAQDGIAELLERVANLVGLHAGARAVFGEPVERDGVTVVPVAQMIIGTGGGSGSSGQDDSGAGAGAGALTRPLGYIEITDEAAVFVPLKRPWQDAGLVVAIAFALLLLAKAARTLLRG
jgi:uncharacterized spore protein YtfJ